MNRNRFLSAFEGLLFEGFDKEIKLSEEDYKSLLKLVGDKDLKDKLFLGFKKNYILEYGNDNSCFLMKMQDFIFRIYSLVILNFKNQYEITNYDDIKNLTNRLIDDSSIDLYSAISFDDTDNEIVKEQAEIIFDTLSLMKHGL